jgi:hypothetical protein
MLENNREAVRELRALQALVCGRDFGGMDDFSQERHHILKLTYSCLKNSKMNFGECQKLAWRQYRDIIKDCGGE